MTNNICKIEIALMLEIKRLPRDLYDSNQAALRASYTIPVFG